MTYTARNFPNLENLQGISQNTIKNHLALYQGYVNNTNKLLNKLERMLADGRTDTLEYAELKRRLGWEFDGMRLHELYFENLGGRGNISGPLGRALAEQFGSLDAWEEDFKATGAIRGIGWSVLYLDNTSGRLINFWINEHECGHPAGCAPILVMDVWEHAYLLDYGIQRAKYIQAFFCNINWRIVGERFRQAY